MHPASVIPILFANIHHNFINTHKNTICKKNIKYICSLSRKNFHTEATISCNSRTNVIIP